MRWRENVGREVCRNLARGGHIALLEHLYQTPSKTEFTEANFRTPAAVGAAFQAAAGKGDLAICKWLFKEFSFAFASRDRSWFPRLMCDAAAESGSMELCKWVKGAGLPWDWRWVHAAAPDSLVVTDTLPNQVGV